MEQPIHTVNQAAIFAKRQLDFEFRKRGIITAIFSGVFYGTYTAFMTLAMTMGIWGLWYSDNSGLPPFAVMFLLSALGAASADSCSAIWAVVISAVKGKLGDFGRCIKTKPGLIMMTAAIIGGPLASTAYVVGIQQAGAIVVPISALCPAIGAILSRILFKQPLTTRMIVGIAICVLSSFMIGSTGLSDSAPTNLYLGLFFGFLAALGWGIEGSICGYSTAMIDPEIGITIRQLTSSLSNLIIFIPLFSLISGVNGVEMVVSAFTDVKAMSWFMVAGLGAYLGFMLWYKGNAMCGAALGMSCNGAFSFWGPFFCWLVLGVAFGHDNATMPPIAWVAAITMVLGIFTIALNPLTFFKRSIHREEANQ